MPHPPHEDDPATAPAKDFAAYLSDVPEDVRLPVDAMVGMPRDAAPTLTRLAARLGWPGSRLWLAALSAEHAGFVEAWAAPDREPAVVLSAFSAWMNNLELAPNDAQEIPDRFAWRPLGTPPAAVRLKARRDEIRASDLDRDDPIGVLANLSDGSNAPNARSAIHDLADESGATVHPADMHGVDRMILSPLPAGAYAVDLAIARERGKITTAAFAGRIRRHARPVGMATAWSARDEDRAPGAHKNDPAGDPRGPVTPDSPRLAKYSRYGPAKKAEMLARLRAEERIGRVDPSVCPVCRDADLGYAESCPLCLRYGVDRLAEREGRPTDPGNSGIAERNREIRRFERSILAMRLEDNPPEGEKARRMAARIGARQERWAVEASRTRKARGRPRKTGQDTSILINIISTANLYRC